jgi:hypothetical protein
MNDTERIDRLEAALRDPKAKLNITRDGAYVNDIFDLRNWLDDLAKPKHYRKPPVRKPKPKVDAPPTEEQP